MIERCADIDVGQAEVVVGATIPDRQGRRCKPIETFGTTTPDGWPRPNWLGGLAVIHVAMASGQLAGAYYMLEADFEGAAGQRRPRQARAGRKTDTIDAAWRTLLLSRGLLKPSFVPPLPIRELRDLTLYRKALINERSRGSTAPTRPLRTPVKLGTAASDVMGGIRRDTMRALGYEVSGVKAGASPRPLPSTRHPFIRGHFWSDVAWTSRYRNCQPGSLAAGRLPFDGA